MKKDNRWCPFGPGAADEQCRTIAFDTLFNEILEHFELPVENDFIQYLRLIRKH
jgi:hypothetical protein